MRGAVTSTERHRRMAQMGTVKQERDIEKDGLVKARD